MENNDKLLIVEVYNHQPILIQKYDTPIQISFRFCQDNALPIKYCKKISETIVRLLKTYAEDNQDLQVFSKYYQSAIKMTKKKVLTLDELVDDKENQQENKQENKYENKQESKQENQLQQQYYSFTNDNNIVVHKSAKNSNKPLTMLQSNILDSHKIQDMSKKLYQKILSPSPDAPQLQYSQTTKHVSVLQRQLQPHKLKKSSERLNRTQTLHTQQSKNSIVKMYLDSTEKKKQSVNKFAKRLNTSYNTTTASNRSLSNGRLKTKN